MTAFLSSSFYCIESYFQKHPSPSSFFRRMHYISNGSVIYYDQLQSSMMAELRYKVKGG